MGLAAYNYKIYYVYDQNGSPIGLNFDGQSYTYEKNIQGDIVGILNDSTRRRVVTYTYDAWGKVTSVTGTDAETVGKYNSLRYRGYYYDTETGYYYLQSRYYDPSYKRFINADDPALITELAKASVLGGNLFAYCGNNAVNDSDYNGMFSFNDLYNKISGFLKNLFNSFLKNLRKQLQITKKYIKIGVAAIKFVLDVIITCVVGKFLKWGIEKIIGWGMKKYIKNSTKSFVKMIGKILNNGATKWLLKTLALRAVNLGYVKSAKNAVKSVAVDTILSVSKVLQKINSICSACSSLSGFIAFIIDLADGKWDDYLTIRFAR